MNIKLDAEMRGMRKTEKGYLYNFEDNQGEPFKVFSKNDLGLEKGDVASLTLACNADLFFARSNG